VRKKRRNPLIGWMINCISRTHVDAKAHRLPGGQADPTPGISPIATPKSAPDAHTILQSKKETGRLVLKANPAYKVFRAPEHRLGGAVKSRVTTDAPRLEQQAVWRPTPLVRNA
jgi:hypothetical protein